MTLLGRRIVNTRAAHQAADFARLIQARGALSLDYPCIAIVPPADPTELDRALRDLCAGAYDWLVLTSANTVLALAERAAALRLSFGPQPPFRTAVIGPATAQAARERLGLHSAVMPDDHIAEALAEALQPLAGARVLLPESAIARPALAEGLAGADLTIIAAYDTVTGSGGVDLPGLLAAGAVDAITFTSSSTVTGLLQRLKAPPPASVVIACIGPATARTARDHGLPVPVVAAEHTLPGLLDALEAYC